MLCPCGFWPLVLSTVCLKKTSPRLVLVSSLLCLQEFRYSGGSKSSLGHLGEAGVGCCVTTLFTQVPPRPPLWGPSTQLHPGLDILISCVWSSATASVPATAVVVPSVPAWQSPIPPGTAYSPQASRPHHTSASSGWLLPWLSAHRPAGNAQDRVLLTQRIGFLTF